MILTKGQTSKKVMILMVDSTDHVTPKTGLSPTVTKSKNGAAFGALSGSVAEVANGWYAITVAAGDVDTSGIVVFHAEAAGADKADVMVEIADTDLFLGGAGVWEELTASHVTQGTFGERMQSIRTGTAQAGAASSITLDASASAVTDFYKGCWIMITAGLGVGQVRIVDAYDGTTKIATIRPNWKTNPDATSKFVVLPQAGVNVEHVNGGKMDPPTVGLLNVNAFVDPSSVITIVAAVWALELETGFTADRILRIIAAAAAGRLSGEPGSPVFRNLGNTLNQITGTADANGNRTAAAYGA